MWSNFWFFEIVLSSACNLFSPVKPIAGFLTSCRPLMKSHINRESCYLLIYCLLTPHPSFYDLLFCYGSWLLKTIFFFCQLALCQVLTIGGPGIEGKNRGRKDYCFFLHVSVFFYNDNFRIDFLAFPVVVGSSSHSWVTSESFLFTVALGNVFERQVDHLFSGLNISLVGSFLKVSIFPQPQW